MRRPMIIVVDDEPEMIRIMTKLFARSGFDTQGLAEGRGAYERIRDAHPQLVFLDLRLGESDGAEVLRAIRRDPELASVPVVLMSGDGEIRHKAEALGADAHLWKPFKAADLLACAARFVGVSPIETAA